GAAASWAARAVGDGALGTAIESQGRLHAVRWAGGEVIDLGGIGVGGAVVTDANDAGVAVGFGLDDLGISQPVRFTSKPEAIALPAGCTGGYATAVNAAGVVVGNATAKDGTVGFVNQPGLGTGTIDDFLDDAPAVHVTAVLDINDSGQ